VYEPVLPQHAAEVLSQLFALSREAPHAVVNRLHDDEADLSSDLLTNLRKFGSVPSPRQLRALKLRLSMTIGGTFKLFGYRLDSMRQFESLLNGERTRFVESYPFHRDRPIDLPGTLGAHDAFQRTSFFSELVVCWQHGIPIRAIRGPHWQKDGFLYAQVGTRDTLAMPKVPPGSFLAIRPIGEKERQNPDPERIYYLQHGSGYLCCHCAVRQGRLLLIARDHDHYTGLREFLYPGQIRIVGRVTSFGVHLPLVKPTFALSRRAYKPAPLILPWEHTSLRNLISAERQRFGITEAQLARASAILESRLGAGVSARTLRRYEHEGKRVPRTAVLLGLTLVHSLRFTDVLRILHLWTDESDNYSLTRLMSVSRYADLPSGFRSADAPEPVTRWQPLLDEWGEWPTLLSMAIPDLERRGRRMLRINQSSLFKGLDPFIAPHSVVVLEEQDELPLVYRDNHEQNWERPLYVLRHDERTFCGYVEADRTKVVLVPHPLAAAVPRMVFRRQQIRILGRVIGVASPL
jgi:hypothetical protein